MKKCPTCGDSFSDKFKFCPVDSSPLSEAGDVLDTATFDAAPLELEGDGANSTATVTAAAVPASTPSNGGARVLNAA